ncbi:ap-4 complex subunit [Plasmopara halstedii]|uniref:Ap-4 complex subunit n=1 Tax=Plasmopara halstedii TaxID=4781 RepID=A0A0N7L820_PLAHL|nr:ap-4 complex subunit [Plasmopara halstedii]CEG48651.1 ap-4 complex subunit [Plasmopara halstedii]|eukprot:XP_024585020.1 ap-4 complex subunit [Plasmopara halstedii]
MSGGHLSKEFFELVKSIGESKSKQEEDRIIIHEVAMLKRKLSEVTATSSTSSSLVNKRKREFLIRLMYVEMLGHDASFGYIKAVEMTASTNLMQKRVGYLTCSLCLSPTHEFRFMIINQLQRDLQSSNHLEVCAALMAVCKLVTVEMVPAVQPMILDLLRHDAELVRKKAVMAIHRFHQLNPDSVKETGDALRRTLCDRDPSVMGATLCILHDLAEATPTDYKDLVPSFVSILKQITEHRLPREFDYHRIPAPWIQIRLLKILALLGQADQQSSEGMYEVLHDVMRRADTGINVGYAIIYECVQTVTTIYPNSTLLDAAAASISRFISSDNHNLKYLGVTGLAAIVKDHPRYAAAHQMAVIDCLEDPDETLKRKTLDLLYRMTNPVNVEFISDKLTQFLREASDVFLRTELVSRITQCAERYAPSNAWYIQTMTNVFELGGDLVRPEVAHNLLRLIAEGSGEDEDQDMELRRDAVDTYLELLERPVLPDILVCTMAWTLGEYGYLSDAMELDEICERLIELVDRPFDQEDTTRGYVLSAVTKITAQMGHTIDVADAMMNKYKNSRSTDLQQRCFEYLALTKNFALMNEVFPEDASCEDIDVDVNLSFLTNFVEKAAAQGAPLYDPPEDSDDEDESYGHRRIGGESNRLNFEAYKKPEIPYATKLPLGDQQSAFGMNKWGGNGTQLGGAPGLGSSGGPDPTGGFGAGKRGGVKNVWGPSGLNTPENVAPGLTGAGAPESYNQGSLGGMGSQGTFNGQSGYGAQPPAYGGQGAYNSQPPKLPPQQEYGGAPSYDNESYNEEDVNGSVDERQILASAIFGGIPGAPAPIPVVRRSGSGARANQNSIRRSARLSTRRSSARNDHQQQQHQAPQNPFGMGSPLAPAPTPEPKTFAPPTSLDPFDMSGLGSSMNANVELGKSPANNLNLLGGSSGNPNIFQYNGRQLEPWQIATQDFGSRWGTCPCEKKTKVNPSGIRTLEDFMGRMHQFNVHTVEAIPATNEAIAACRLVNSEHVGLIHVKIRSGGFVDLTVRTADMDFTDQLIEATARRLK